MSGPTAESAKPEAGEGTALAEPVAEPVPDPIMEAVAEPADIEARAPQQMPSAAPAGADRPDAPGGTRSAVLWGIAALVLLLVLAALFLL